VAATSVGDARPYAPDDTPNDTPSAQIDRVERPSGAVQCAARAEGVERPGGAAGAALGTITDCPAPTGPAVAGAKASGLTWFALKRRSEGAFERDAPGAAQTRRDETRAERWDLRRAYRKFTETKRVAACGRPGLREDGSVVLRVTDGTGTPAAGSTGASGRIAGYAGLFHCGNVWLCAECSVKIAAQRAARLETVLAHYLVSGGWAVMVTLTMRHHRRHGLAECRTAATDAWDEMTKARRWGKDRKASGMAGYCRALEVTESMEHGWHVHFHTVLVFDTRPSDAALARVTDGMFDRWSASLQRGGMPAPIREHGIDVMQLDTTAAAPTTVTEQARAWARYVVKGLAQESVLGVVKDAKGSNRSIRQLMRDALFPQAWEAPQAGEIVHTLDLRARARLGEYEKAMKGARQLTWSRELGQLAKALCGEDLTDQEIAESELEGEDVAVIPRDSWVVVERRATELLSVTEREGAEGAHRWLDALGVEWWHPTGLTDQRRHGEPPGGARRLDP
jgi:hypothetical protein